MPRGVTPAQAPDANRGKSPTRDRATVIGCIGAFAVVMLSMIMDGGNPFTLLLPAPIILVFGGTTLAALASTTMKDAKNVPSVAKKALSGNNTVVEDTIPVMVHLAEVARREGLLALEKASAEITDPFFKKGIELTVDGTDPEEIRDILEGEIDALRARHSEGGKFFADMGGFSPTLGILGTVIGLIRVLANLSSPGLLGPAIASAFTATLWGVLSANLFWIPISNKLKRVSSIEVAQKRLMLDGLLAIQSGSTARMVEARLMSWLSPRERDDLNHRRAA
jgi:chemotaxis protein MotA